MARDKFPKTTIAIQIETCKECVFVRSTYTINAGCADDYHCCYPHHRNEGMLDKIRGYPMVMSYVEYSVDEKPVPDWCPIKLNGNAATIAALLQKETT